MVNTPKNVLIMSKNKQQLHLKLLVFPLVVKLLIELENSQKPFRKISIKISITISETITNKHGNEIPKERYVYPVERQEIIDGLRLKQQYKNGISKNNY